MVEGSSKMNEEEKETDTHSNTHYSTEWKRPASKEFYSKLNKKMPSVNYSWPETKMAVEDYLNQERILCHLNSL